MITRAYLAAVLLSILSLSKGVADAQETEYPPAVSVNGYTWTNSGGGSYSGGYDSWAPSYFTSLYIGGFVGGSNVWLSGVMWQEGYSVPGTSASTDELGNYYPEIPGGWVYAPGWYPYSVSGTYSRGAFSINGATVMAVDSSGSPWPPRPAWASTPRYGGPPALWINGAIRYCLSDENSGADYYYSPDWWDYITINGSTVSSSVSGSYTTNADGGVFVLPNSTFDLRPTNANGAPMQTSATATYGPPGVAVMGVFWKFQGTFGNADYYKGASAGQVLKFTDDATVVVNNPPTNTVNASGSFAWGVFQDLPFEVTPLNADGSVLAPLAAHQGPLAVIVAGEVWRYSSIGGTDYDTYVGSQSGQLLYIYGGNSVWVSDPYRDIDAAGTYANGTFQVLGVAVQAANLYGTPEQFTAQNRQQNAAGLTTITGPLDVYGNLLSLGTAREDVSRAGFNLGFTDSAPGMANSASTISLVAGRPENQWIWSHASATSSGTVPMMKLDQGNRLMLYSPVDGTPRIVFDPIGGSNFQGPVRVQRQGDLSMGEFVHGPQP